MIFIFYDLNNEYYFKRKKIEILVHNKKKQRYFSTKNKKQKTKTKTNHLQQNKKTTGYYLSGYDGTLFEELYNRLKQTHISLQGIGGNFDDKYAIFRSACFSALWVLIRACGKSRVTPFVSSIFSFFFVYLILV